MRCFSTNDVAGRHARNRLFSHLTPHIDTMPAGPAADASRPLAQFISTIRTCFINGPFNDVFQFTGNLCRCNVVRYYPLILLFRYTTPNMPVHRRNKVPGSGTGFEQEPSMRSIVAGRLTVPQMRKHAGSRLTRLSKVTEYSPPVPKKTSVGFKKLPDSPKFGLMVTSLTASDWA